MYLPSQFEETRPEALQRLMREHPLGMLITLGPDGIEANPVPFIFDPAPAPFGTLRAHVARSNPVWRNASADIDTLVVFQGPQAYVSPSWYASKKEHGKVVPTWNYMTVQARGRLRAIDDPVWLRGLLERLTDTHEAGRASPWTIDDAPDGFIDELMGAIVGIEIPVARMVGKWKVSQNRSPADRVGVARGLTESGAHAMADAVVHWRREE